VCVCSCSCYTSVPKEYGVIKLEPSLQNDSKGYNVGAKASTPPSADQRQPLRLVRHAGPTERGVRGGGGDIQNGRKGENDKSKLSGEATSPLNSTPASGVRSLLKGIKSNDDGLKGFLQLHSSASAHGVSQQVFCEMGSRRYDIMGGPEMSTPIFKIDLRTLKVVLHKPSPKSLAELDGSSISSFVNGGGGGGELTMLQVSFGEGKEKDLIYLQAADTAEAKKWCGEMFSKVRRIVRFTPSCRANFV
jgi:hypothetical protein